MTSEALSKLSKSLSSSARFELKLHQIPFLAGSASDPAGGAHDTPPDPLVGWGL